MLQNALREDALTVVPGGYELRIGLPWIRSMPLSSVSGLAMELDGWPVDGQLRVNLGKRSVHADTLADEPGWWFIQDRLVLAFPAMRPGERLERHDVSVDFELMVPYLQAGGDGPLVLPFHLEAKLPLARPGFVGVSRDVA